VSTQDKYLAFKGVEKKEQILFKSFLNLAKNELTYTVTILKDSEAESQSPDIVIKDALYEYSDAEEALKALPTIEVGNDVTESSPGYLSRPVQWSDFRTELTRLDEQTPQEQVEEQEFEQSSDERVLPGDMEFVIADMDEKSEEAPKASGALSFSEAEEYDYELDNMSIDYHSFTNSDYMKVVDDVRGFNDDEQEDPDLVKATLLMTDDESGSTNSVLVIETNTLDAWEMSEAEFEDEPGARPDGVEALSVDESIEKELTEKLESGTPIKPGDEFWRYDLEVFSGRESLFFIKAERQMVYSACEPGKWPGALSEHEVTKIPMASNWHPIDGLKAYPMSNLLWATNLAHNNTTLADGLDDNTEYILERWPKFELLELDNVLLKLCTLLFVSPESAYSLMQKSGYGRQVVYGLLNACNDLGILRNASEVTLEQFSELGQEEGVFGKIKDVFR
jgi:hypothetical protein